MNDRQLMQSGLILTVAALLVTGCVVYGSSTDQDKQLWSDNNGSFSWTDCSECCSDVSVV